MGLTTEVARAGTTATERLLLSRRSVDPGRCGSGWPSRLRVACAASTASPTRASTRAAGRALLTAQPDALGRLAARLEHGCALVSATNGKTTTTNLLASIVRAAGLGPVVNHVGANMPGGICAELLAGARWSATADIGVFEVDELWLDHVVPPLVPRVIVLGNLFRDQLDRMGEIDRVAARWRAFVARLDTRTVLVVNADDPRVCQLTAGHSRIVHFGLDACDREAPAPGGDQATCLRCAGRFAYDGAHIAHLGRWRCTGCGDRRPDRLEVEARDVELHGTHGVSFTLDVEPVRPDGIGGGDTTGPRSERIVLGLPGRFNVANAAAAAAAALAIGCTTHHVVTGLGGAKGAFGRAERLSIAGREVVQILAKNPSGLDEIVTMLVAAGRPLDLLFVLNDRDLDGRDVSWIWDADVERIAPLVMRATCGGSRAAEAAMRLDYAGVDPCAIEVVDGIAEPLSRALARARGPIHAVTNYSAMLDLRETVAEQGHAKRYWS
ncbi:MAG: MurT ligase domain-containing protein [Ilumatobacteraceae bacterium]